MSKSQTTIRDFNGKILGFCETDSTTLNETYRSFNGQIVSRYDANRDVTTDFAGRVITRGNTASGFLLNRK